MVGLAGGVGGGEPREAAAMLGQFLWRLLAGAAGPGDGRPAAALTACGQPAPPRPAPPSPALKPGFGTSRLGGFSRLPSPIGLRPYR